MRPSLALWDRRDARLRRLTGRQLPLALVGATPSACRQGQGPRPDEVAEPERVAEQYTRALESLAARPLEPLALTMTVPFCAAHCLCCDRDIRAAQPQAVIDDYVEGLLQQFQDTASRLGGDREVLQWHLGGGTLTELDDAALSRLVRAVQARWRVPADAELSIECDPRRIGRAQLQRLRGLGFRQIHFGVLDLDAQVQQAIGRCHSAALIDDACDLARGCGFETIGLELMVGLPLQDETRWRATLERIVAIAPDRVTLVRYRHRPRQAPAQCAIDAEQLPDGRTCSALADLAAARLREAGYRWLGANCFVLENDELCGAASQGRLRRNLIGYTGMPRSALLGLGAGAVTDVDGHLFWNLREPLWRDALRTGRLPVARARRATEQGQRRRQAAELLLCTLELPAQWAHGGLEAAYADLARHEADGLVHVLEDRIVVTDAGRHLLPQLCAELDGAATAADAPVWWS